MSLQKMEWNKNKYRSQSHRRPNWDYSSNALYFLTIVTQNRICNLGEIINNQMVLSDFGKIVEIEWFRSFEIRKELFLDVFIIMPNHIHAIVEIFQPVETHGRVSDNFDNQCIIPSIVETHDLVSIVDNSTNLSDSYNQVETHGRDSNILKTHDRVSLQKIKKNPPIRLPKSISSFIAGFKSSINTQIDNYIDENQMNIPKYNKLNHFFQSNYHDHIIRNNDEYLKIKDYIENNPYNWDGDILNNSIIS